MKFKIKVKTLIGLIVGTLFLAFIVSPFINLTIASYLNEKGSDGAEAFYNNYMASPIKINEKEGLYGYGESLIQGFEKFKIKFAGRGGGEDKTSPENMEKAMEAFEKSLLIDNKKGYIDEYSPKAYLKLLDISITTLDMDKLLYWINWGKTDENEEIRYTSRLYEAYYYFVEKDYNRAKEILEDFDEGEFNKKQYELMGDVNLRLGNIEKAREYYETRGETQIWRGTSNFGVYFGGSGSNFGQNEIEDYIKKSQGDYKIRGKVSHDGVGLPFVEIYISEYIGAISTSGEKPWAITDGKGEFETLGLEQGVYDIGIGMHPSQIHNKVYLNKNIFSIELNSDIEFNFEFVTPIKINDSNINEGEDLYLSWDKVEAADYYEVETLVFHDPKNKRGSYHKITLSDINGEEKLKTNSGNFHRDKVDKRSLSYSFSGEDLEVSPMAILGSIIPEIEYPLIVNAYDKENNRISSSLPLISDYEDMISIEIDGKLTEGEKLILNREYEKAVDYYQNKLIENPKDKEALFYLARFYSIGWKKDKKDIAKALKYAEIYNKEYRDYNLSFEIINSMRIDEIKENRELVKKTLEITPEENRDTNYYRQLAIYFIIEEDYTKARESYEKMTAYKDTNLIYIDMYLGDYEKAISRLESGELSLIKMNRIPVIEGLKNMDSVSQKDRDLFKEILKMSLDKELTKEEEEEVYNKTYSSISSLELKKLLKEIGKEEYWVFEDYY